MQKPPPPGIPKSPVELDTDINVGCYAKLRKKNSIGKSPTRLDKHLRYGTVYWLGKCGDDSVVGLLMNIAHKRKINKRFQHLSLPKLLPEEDFENVDCGSHFFVKLQYVEKIPHQQDPRQDDADKNSSRKPAVAADDSNYQGNGPENGIREPEQSVEKHAKNLQVKTTSASTSDMRLSNGNLPVDGSCTGNMKITKAKDSAWRVAWGGAPPITGTSDAATTNQGQTAGRYEKTNEDITNVKQQVLGIKSTLIKMKGDLYADIAEVNKKVNAVQNILDSNLNKTGAISDEMAAFRTEIQRQAGEFKKYESVLNEEREERKALAKMLKNEQEKRKASEIKYFRLIVIIVILFIAWCVREKSMNSTQSSMEYKTNDTTSQSAVMADEDYGISVNDKLGMFDSSMSKIKSNFPEEDGRFWSSIFAPILRIIQEQYPSRPAVVLIATTRPYSAIAECLSREVASQIEILYELNDNSDNFLTLEATRLKSLDPEKAKSQFDKELSDNYRQRHMVAVIHDLGSLPASAATLLHAYCDHESAHFKKVVLLATVYLEPGIKPCTEEVEAYLAEVWQELEEDVLKPLISRVANNIAIMEDSGVSNYICRT